MAGIAARMTNILLASICISAAHTSGQVWSRLVDAVAEVESGRNHRAVGDHGQAHGAWQIHWPAWKDVNTSRRERGLNVYGFPYAHDPKVSRLYAREYLAILSNRLEKHLNRPPTAAEIYMAYRIGVAGFKKRGFYLQRCPRDDVDAACRIQNILSS